MRHSHIANEGTTSNRILENFRNSHINSNLISNCEKESLEKELYSQVSNVVSSFFSKLDPQTNHLRQK